MFTGERLPVLTSPFPVFWTHSDHGIVPQKDKYFEFRIAKSTEHRIDVGGRALPMFTQKRIDFPYCKRPEKTKEVPRNIAQWKSCQCSRGPFRLLPWYTLKTFYQMRCRNVIFSTLSQYSICGEYQQVFALHILSCFDTVKLYNQNVFRQNICSCNRQLWLIKGRIYKWPPLLWHASARSGFLLCLVDIWDGCFSCNGNKKHVLVIPYTCLT